MDWNLFCWHTKSKQPILKRKTAYFATQNRLFCNSKLSFIIGYETAKKVISDFSPPNSIIFLFATSHSHSLLACNLYRQHGGKEQ